MRRAVLFLLVTTLIHTSSSIFDQDKFHWLGKERPVTLCFHPCKIVTTRMPGRQKEFCACEVIGHRRFLKFKHYYREGIKMQNSIRG